MASVQSTPSVESSAPAQPVVFGPGARVAVLLPLPVDTAYDYVVPEGASFVAGDIVEVPLARRFEVGVVWDFNGLSYKAKMANPDDYVVLIPSDGSVISGYTTIINKYAKHPNAAKLTREYIFSDAGQTNLARGNARPIRAEHLTLPADVQAKKVDVTAEIQADKEVRVQRLNQSLDKSQLNYSFDKQSSTLSVKVVNKQSGDFIRQLDFKGFHAMEFSTHGYKGRVVDNAA